MHHASCAPAAAVPVSTPMGTHPACLPPLLLRRLAAVEDVRTVMCLQEDSDMAYFSLDVAPILVRCLPILFCRAFSS